MNEDLRRALDRAAGEDPHVDLAEAVWAQGRVVRRRRQAAQVVGGAAAAVVLAGAFILGGGLFEPQADVGPAQPTIHETADATVPVPTTEETVEPTTDETEEPTTEDTAEPSTEDTAEPTTGDADEPTGDGAEPTGGGAEEPTTEDPVEPTTPEQTEPVETPAPEGLALTSTSIGGLPLSGPTADLVAAVSADFGQPVSSEVDVVGGCSGDEIYSLYNWDGFLLYVQGADGPDAHRSWETQSSEVALPNGVRIGMTLDEVRALDTVTELPSVASPHYQLGSGIVVSTADGTVVNAQSERGEVC